MGMVESAVVIYLRELYYPGGFKFPVQPTSTTVAITEVIREIATMIMLLAIGMLAGKSKTGRFAWFIYSFAIWDISYYNPFNTQLNISSIHSIQCLIEFQFQYYNSQL
jgi:hypothetical protein